MGKKDNRHFDGTNRRVVWHYGRSPEGREVTAAFLSPPPVPIHPVQQHPARSTKRATVLGNWEWLSENDSEALFPLGELFLGAGRLDCDSAELEFALIRHATGEWGDVLDTVKLQNRDALRFGGRLISLHRLKYHSFTIITEANRRRTTVFVSDIN